MKPTEKPDRAPARSTLHRVEKTWREIIEYLNPDRPEGVAK